MMRGAPDLRVTSCAAAALLASLALSSCKDEGDTVVIYTNGAGGIRGGNEGGGDDGAAGHGGDPASSAGGADAASGSSGASSTAGTGQGASSASGGTSAGSGSAGAGGGSGGQTYEGALFVEDFEDGDLDGWQYGPSAATFEVTTSTAANGSSKSLSTVGTDSNYYEGASFALEGLRPSKVSWWVQAVKGLGAYYEAFLTLSTDPDTTTADPLFFARMNVFGIEVVGNEVYGNETLMLAGAPAADQWHHFEVEIDWELGTYDVTLDGTMVGTDDFSSENRTGIWRIDLFNTSPDNVVLYDEIVLMP